MRGADKMRSPTHATITTNVITFAKRTFALLSITLFICPSAVRALSSDQTNVFNSGVNYFDIASGGASGTCSTILTGGDQVQQAFNFLIGKGLSKEAAAGILGNLKMESGVDPTAEQTPGAWEDMSDDYNHAVGLAQWDGSRRPTMINYAEAHGLTLQDLKNGGPKDMSFQLDYLWLDLTTNYPGTYAQLKHDNDVAQATLDFLLGFENGSLAVRQNPELAFYSKRLAYAEQILGQYGGSAVASTGQTCTGSASGSIAQIALGEVGTHETNGDNDSATCKYQGSACPPGQEWCADFVSWVYNQAGSPFTGGLDGGWRIPGAAAVAEWFKANGTWINYTGHLPPTGSKDAPQPGDVIYYPDNGGHVNIVVSYDGKTIMTVGGNESDAVSKAPSTLYGTPAGWGRIK